MASISVSEATFDALADAAHLAKRRGDLRLAAKLDRLARMTNAALSNSRGRRFARMVLPGSKALTWRDVPSVFDEGAT